MPQISDFQSMQIGVVCCVWRGISFTTSFRNRIGEPMCVLKSSCPQCGRQTNYQFHDLIKGSQCPECGSETEFVQCEHTSMSIPIRAHGQQRVLCGRYYIAAIICRKCSYTDLLRPNLTVHCVCGCEFRITRLPCDCPLS